jgi:hypothetical protein
MRGRQAKMIRGAARFAWEQLFKEKNITLRHVERKLKKAFKNMERPHRHLFEQEVATLVYRAIRESKNAQ